MRTEAAPDGDGRRMMDDRLPRRIQRLRAAILDAVPSISATRAVAYTRVYVENPGLSAMSLRAKALKYACETAPVAIFDDELIVGHPAGRRRAGLVTPEIAWRWVEKELDSCATRAQDPYVINEADKHALRTEVFPFWQGRSVDETVTAELVELGFDQLVCETGIIDCEVKSANGAGEVSPGYANVLLRSGFRGIKAAAEERLGRLRASQVGDVEKIEFLRAVTTVCDGMITLAARYAEHARELAAREPRPERRDELNRIADVCARVPTEPPRTFHEALQAIWFTNSMLSLEENQVAVSPGRLDQYVYPFLSADLDAGLLTPDEAEELLCCFLLKFNELPSPLSEFAAKYFAGYIPFYNIVVGGQTRHGGDATNELSFMVMDCVDALGMYQPSLAARIHNGSPPVFLRRVADLIASGNGFPACHFDDAVIRILLSKGVSRDDARDYCLIGCVEPYVHGKMSQWTSACYTNFAICVEFALFDGEHLRSGLRLGRETGDPTSFATFAEFEAAVKAQMDYITEVCAAVTLVNQRAHRRHAPKPLLSSLIEGCVETGRDVMDGGAHYNWGPGLQWVGTADYANSMAAVKRLVYDDKKVTMADLVAALRRDFVGHEEIHRLCLDAPKYGNDDDYVDAFARDVIDYAAQATEQYRGLHAPMSIGTVSVSTNTPQGAVVGALPSGRRAGKPLAEGISPSQGTDVRGPTAIIKSADKINHEAMSIGVLHNMKLDPGVVRDEEGIANLIALLRVHGRLGGAQLQFNCVSRETLLAAQEHPEDHQSLLVRVAGYSARFVELCPEIQNDIISRTPQTAWR